MIRIVAVGILLFFIFAIVYSVQRIWHINLARRKGLFPKKGKATLFDVKKLIEQGEKELAIILYCEIFSTTNKNASRAVEELERNIKR